MSVCTFLVPPRKVPKRRRAKGSTPLQSPGSVEGAYDSTPAPEICMLWHPSTHCRAASRAAYRSHPPGGKCSLLPPLRLSPAGPRCWARLGTPCLAGATKCAWPSAIWEAPRRGRCPHRPFPGERSGADASRSCSPGVTSNKGGRSPPCAWSVGGGCQEGEYEIPLLTASLVTFCAFRKSPPGGYYLRIHGRIGGVPLMGAARTEKPLQQILKQTGTAPRQIPPNR